MARYKTMIERKDIEVGAKFWGLEILRIYMKKHDNGQFKEHAECRCNCGTIFSTQLDCIRNGSSKTCGCYLGARGRGIINIDGTIDTSNGVYKCESNTGEKCISVDKKGVYRVTIQYSSRGVLIARTFHNLEVAKKFRDYAQDLVRDHNIPINEVYTNIHIFCKKMRLYHRGRNCDSIYPGAKIYALDILGYTDNHEELGSRGHVRCRCKCGTEFTTAIQSIASGSTRSCGCYLGLKGVATIHKNGTILYKIDQQSNTSSTNEKCISKVRGYYKVRVRRVELDVDITRSFRSLDHAILFRNMVNRLLISGRLNWEELENISNEFAKDIRNLYGKELEQHSIEIKLGGQS